MLNILQNSNEVPLRGRSLFSVKSVAYRPQVSQLFPTRENLSSLSSAIVKFILAEAEQRPPPRVSQMFPAHEKTIPSWKTIPVKIIPP